MRVRMVRKQGQARRHENMDLGKLVVTQNNENLSESPSKTFCLAYRHKIIRLLLPLYYYIYSTMTIGEFDYPVVCLMTKSCHMLSYKIYWI